MSDDLFDTARLRGQVLDAWAASPARFREDANAEEELALGGYRDRLVVELAQNAADAAARGAAAGMPAWRVGGRLRLTLRDGVLAAANTGAALDADGVRSLSSLRASAKRDEPVEAVGRFGVGFAAVLAVSDEPSIVSRHGGVRWSRAEARALVEQRVVERSVPELGDELVRRDGAVPLLRLPFPAEGTPPADYDTVVMLPLRDGGAAELARRLLAEVDDALLLALPHLSEVTVEIEGETSRWWVSDHDSERSELVITCQAADGATGETRWRYLRRAGTLAPALLADRPVEERARRSFAVMWATPVTASGVPSPPATRPVVHAPTPTDEPLGLPALLVASLPLDVTRRHVAPGPLRDHLIEIAAHAYTDLLASLAPDPATLSWAPERVGHGEVDALLRERVIRLVPETPFLPFDEDPGGVRQRPRDAIVVAAAAADLVAALRPVLPGLLPAGWDRDPAALARAGVRRVSLGEVVDLLAGLRRPASWWRQLYEVLAAGQAAADRDALAALPVPLATEEYLRELIGENPDDGDLSGDLSFVLGGDDARLSDDDLGAEQGGLAGAGSDAGDYAPAGPRSWTAMAPTVRGPRGLLLPADRAQAAALLGLGLRVAHPDAVHPLLERLGATPATPSAVLMDSRTKAMVAASYDAALDGMGDHRLLAASVLELVRAADALPGDYPYLAELALVDADGEPAPAGELMLPGSPIAAIARPDTLGLVHPDLVARWGERVLEAVGVLRTLGVSTTDEVLLDPDECASDLDAGDEWCAATLATLPEADVPPVVATFTGVRDLDVIADTAWGQALALLAEPPLRAAVTQPARVLLPDGKAADVLSYTAWWLRNHAVLGGRVPSGLRAADGDPVLAGLYDEATPTPDLDAEFLRALGVRTDLMSLLAEANGPQEVLTRLADPDRSVTADHLRRLYGALAGAPLDAVTPPDRMRALVNQVPVVVDAAAVVIVDAPDLLPVIGERPLLLVAPDQAGDLADLLALPLASELTPARPVSEGVERPVPPAVLDMVGGAPATYVEHDELWIDAAPVRGHLDVPWRYVDGVLHSATLDGLARGLAWAAGSWQRRFEVEVLLTEPERVAELRLERGFE